MAITKKTTKPAAKATAKPAAKKPAAKAAPAAKKTTTKPAAAPAKAPVKTVGKAAPGKKPVAKKGKKTPIPTFAAPADFRPHFLLVAFMTDKDGLIGASVKATRYAGRFDRAAEDKKKFNLGEYDSATLVGIAARLGAVTFKPSHERIMPVSPKERVALKGSNRLPKSTVFEVLMRVGKKSADGSLTAGIKQVFQIAKIEKGGKTVQKPVLLEKTDPAYRLIRRATRILPAAFKNVQMPPKRTRGSRKADDEGEE